MKINYLVDKLKSENKNSILINLFRKQILKKFNNLIYGKITVEEKDRKFEFGNSNDKLSVNVTILNDKFYSYIGTNGLIGASEAYTLGYWKSDDIVKLIQIIFRNKETMQSMDSSFSNFVKPLNSLIHKKRENSLIGSKKNIVAHYDLSNDFYQLWLDKTMTYSCGIFTNSNSTMEDASYEKIDRLCRKINLSKDDNILEIGTGWGSFAIHAAKNYGCNITTTTISNAQYQYVKSIIKKENISNKINLVKKDYRDLDGKFNKIISIEMIEAVGYKYIPTYFKKISSLLTENGQFAMQGITYNDQNFIQYRKSVDFIQKYIFPGSCLISINHITEIIKKYTDLSISHLEDITHHYAKTLNIWRKNFLTKKNEIKKLGFSDEFINLWEFYLVYCEAGFLERNIGDYQFIFSKSGLKNVEVKY
ncbi:MAG: hypothetical protein CMF96_11980 [Candidatus Marinimicrobia bacterium]|nr:hypothetical protein [Candidatus Neomarinimicrobiota bacterium]|tara:strand:- start:540 stop:1799 length:1260 start_codon:yes stop_codon:yes gene_type:complete